GAGRVLRRKLYVVGVLASAANAFDRATDDLFLGHLELELTVNGAGSQENMDTPARAVAQSCAGAIDVGGVAARQAADDGAAHFFRDGLHRLEIAWRGDREAGLDDIDAEIFQGMSHLQFFRQVHAGAGTLFSISQSRVKNDEAVVHDLAPGKQKSPRMLILGLCSASEDNTGWLARLGSVSP